MIRPLTILTMLLAAGSGAYLFAVKHRAQVLDDQLASVAQQTRLDEQRIRVLQAQWALETAPPRLQQLAAQFTDLQPMKPAQLVTLASLTASLPPPGKVAPEANPAAPAPAEISSNAASDGSADSAMATAMPAVSAAAPENAEPAPAQAVAAALVKTVAPASAQQQIQASVAAPKPVASVKLASLTSHHSASRQERVASRSSSHGASHPAVSHLAVTQVAENLPPPRPVHSFYQAPMSSIRSLSTPISTPAPMSGGGSSLALASDLPPPRPLSSSENE